MKKLSIALAVITTLYSGFSQAATITASASFEDPLPLHLDQGVRHAATINVGSEFSSLERICFTTHFEGDLADPDEQLFLGPFGSASYGWTNINSTPFSVRTVCITDAHGGADLFLDGEQTFDVRMSRGQATLTRLDVSITGEVAFVPTHDVSIQLDEGEGEIGPEGGRVEYSAQVSNLDLNSTYKDFRRWSVLSLPTGENYSIHKASTVQLSAGQVKNYKRPYLNIPDWFPAGLYTLTWYFADPLNELDTINSDTLVFEKLEN